MQRGAQALMRDTKSQMGADGVLRSVYVHRVAMCMRGSTGGAPSIWRSPKGEASEYADVLMCGSVWHCPICSPKITSGRRAELQAAVGAWVKRGGEVYLATRTHSHTKHERGLPEQLALFAKCVSRHKASRRAGAVRSRAGCVGDVAALETTHGEINGWHPHKHELIFARPGERERLLSMRNGYIRQLIKSGLAGFVPLMTRDEKAAQLRFLRKHALTVQGGNFASDYIAKFGLEPQTDNGGRWGPASEVTRGAAKVGARLTGRTPFELLRQYIEGDERCGFLYRDYALAFDGKRQLFWSRGLRKNLVDLCEGVAEEIYFTGGAVKEWRDWREWARVIGREKSDEQLATERAAACTEFVLRPTTDEWRDVLKTNMRFEVLMAARLGGVDDVRALLAELKTRRSTHGGAFVEDWRRWERGRWTNIFNGERVQ